MISLSLSLSLYIYIYTYLNPILDPNNPNNHNEPLVVTDFTGVFSVPAVVKAIIDQETAQADDPNNPNNILISNLKLKLSEKTTELKDLDESWLKKVRIYI